MPRWFFWTLLALACWGVWAVMSKLIGEALSAPHSQALSTLGLLPVMGALAFSRKRSESATSRRGIVCAFGAGVLGCLGNVAYYHALSLGGKASTVTPLTALYPLVTVILALLVLKERLNTFQRFGIGLSLAAIYLFNVQTGRGLVSAWLLYALIPIALWGVAGMLQKISTNHVSGETSTLWFLAAFVPVAAAILLTQGLPAHITPRTWALVVALGLFLGLGNYAILVAFASTGKASVITPLTGLYPLVSVPLAILFLHEKVGPREFAGIGLALASVVALSMESRPDSARIAGMKSETPQ